MNINHKNVLAGIGASAILLLSVFVLITSLGLNADGGISALSISSTRTSSPQGGGLPNPSGPGTSQGLILPVSFETSKIGTWSIPVCNPPAKPECPAIGQEVTIEAWGVGGRGGEAADGLDKGEGGGPGGGGGAGGGAGGYVKASYVIPKGATLLSGKLTPGETNFGTTVNGANQILGKAYAGYVGSDATLHGGGTGGAGPNSGKSTVVLPATLIDSKNGSNGTDGETRTVCTVIAKGGIGAPPNTGYGAGGNGGTLPRGYLSGSKCTTKEFKSTSTAGGAGRIKVSWTTDQGLEGTGPKVGPSTGLGSADFDYKAISEVHPTYLPEEEVSPWRLTVCEGGTRQACPSVGAVITVELWGGGGGGNGGESVIERSRRNPFGGGGAGGNGGDSGKYIKFNYTIPAGTTSLYGSVGYGGDIQGTYLDAGHSFSGVIRPWFSSPGGRTTIHSNLTKNIAIASGGEGAKEFGLNNSCVSNRGLGGQSSFPNRYGNMIPFSVPDCFNYLLPDIIANYPNWGYTKLFGTIFSEITNTNSNKGQEGSKGLTCTGGGGGKGGTPINGYGGGGDGGHGGYWNSFPTCTKAGMDNGLTLPFWGKGGHVRISW